MPAERRVDPHDGRAYTADELSDKYRGEYSLEEITEYWAGLVPHDAQPGSDFAAPSGLSPASAAELEGDLRTFSRRCGADVRLGSGRLLGSAGLGAQARAELERLLQFYAGRSEGPVAEPGACAPGTGAGSSDASESSRLRFARGDRVVCNLGIYWAAGRVIDTSVVDPEDPEGPRLPYFVRLDPNAGYKEPTSLVSDDDETIRREVCFDSRRDLHLTKVAAPCLEDAAQGRLRFELGARVVCRVRDSEEGAATWAPGVVFKEWPRLPPPHRLPYGRPMAERVPYAVRLDAGGLVYAHWDDHTLVRREDLAPQREEHGLARRFEVRRRPDGVRVRLDHQTMCSRALPDGEDDTGSESEGD